MTATTQRPSAESDAEPVRISWMETLGFSESTSVWSDRPLPQNPPQFANNHLAETLADWEPTEVGTDFTKRKVRWGLIVTLLVLAGVVTYGTLWFMQRPAEQAAAATAGVATEATSLAATLPGLEEANASLVEGVVSSDALVATDQAARSLFESSSGLEDQREARSAASDAASKSLDAVRLINDANAYRLAVTPILNAPDLVFDPELTELDEAARSFGDWQLQFDAARTALPDGVLSDITEQLDILSGNLDVTLRAYIDGLRENDASAARQAIDDLATQLDAISVDLSSALAETQARATERIEEAKAALDLLVG